MEEAVYVFPSSLQGLPKYFLVGCWLKQYFWLYVTEQRSGEGGEDKGEIGPLKSCLLYKMSHVKGAAE